MTTLTPAQQRVLLSLLERQRPAALQQTTLAALNHRGLVDNSGSLTPAGQARAERLVAELDERTCIKRRSLVLRGVKQAWDGKTPELAAAALTTWLDDETLDRVEAVLGELLAALRAERAAQRRPG